MGSRNPLVSRRRLPDQLAASRPGNQGQRKPAPGGGASLPEPKTIGLLVEKIPFFALAAAAGLLTYMAPGRREP